MILFFLAATWLPPWPCVTRGCWCGSSSVVDEVRRTSAVCCCGVPSRINWSMRGCSCSMWCLYSPRKNNWTPIHAPVQKRTCVGTVYTMAEAVWVSVAMAVVSLVASLLSRMRRCTSCCCSVECRRTPPTSPGSVLETDVEQRPRRRFLARRSWSTSTLRSNATAAAPEPLPQRVTAV